jgi:ubiquinone/menaquinone biosynthesis C-methylase UbiE
MSRRLLAEGFCKKLIALEPWSDNFALLRRNLAEYPNKEILQASALDMPLPDRSIDCILSTQVLEHIVEDATAVAEMARVLKEGGYAIVSVPHPPEIIPNVEHVRPGYTEEQLICLLFKYKYIFKEYFCTLPTLRRLIAAEELPLQGRFLPAAWADRESRLSNEERAKLQPYGILCLFRAPSQN